MEKSVTYVGLDYHQHSVQVCMMDAKGRILSNRPCANDWHAIAQCLPKSKPRATVRAAIEACCGSADLAEELVAHAGWSVALAHPGYVARIKQSPDKTDFCDAQLLADLERVGYLPRVWLAPEPVRELRRVVRYRQGLVQERRGLKLRICALLREQRIGSPQGLSRWGKGWMAWLKDSAPLSREGRWVAERLLVRLASAGRQIAEVQAHLEQLTATDELVGRLLTMKGIGLITACTLRAEIGRFSRFRSGKQLSRFCGFSPANRSSGQRVADAGLIQACNKALRAVIVEAAHRLIRYDTRWGALAHQLRERGKPGSVVAAAVGNRWLRWLWQQMKQIDSEA
jgi:transposase